MKYVVDRQQEDGSFTGDEWGEVDNRFCICAVATLASSTDWRRDQTKTARFVIPLAAQSLMEGLAANPGQSHTLG